MSQILLSKRQKIQFSRRFQQGVLIGQHRFSPTAYNTSLAGKPAATVLQQGLLCVTALLPLEQPTSVQRCASALITSRSRDWKDTSSADNSGGNTAEHQSLPPYCCWYRTSDAYKQLILQQ